MSFEISEEKSHHSQFQGNKIPSDWNCARIKELAKINTETVKKSDKLGVIRYVDIASVNNRQIEQVQILDFEKAPSRARRKVRNGDILISTVRPNLKHFTILKDPPNNMLVSTGFAVISAEKIDPYFLYYFLTSDRYTEFLSNIAENQTSAYPAFNPSVIEETEIYFPERNEQEKISRILSVLDEKIELNNRINKNLEEMAQTIFKRWFVDFEFPNENGEPYKASGGEFVESELGMIPKGWRVGNLGEIISITSGKRPKNRSANESDDYNVPLVGASSVMGYVKDALFTEPILVIGRVGTHGVVQRYNGKCWPSDNTLVIRSKFHEFVYQFLKTLDYKALNRGSTQPLITQTDVKNSRLIIPLEETLMKFEEIVSPFFRMIERNITQARSLKLIRDTLLPKLMSGEIRVPLD